MPYCYPYCRVSTERQATLGGSLEVQEAAALRAFEYEYEPRGFKLGAVIRDPAESAGKALLSRPGGAQLSLLLEAGDVVIFPKLDRGFRNTEDMLRTIRLWKAKGASVRMLDISVDTATPVGELILTVMAATAQFERQRLVERIKGAWAYRRQRRAETGDVSIVTHSRAPYGYRVQLNNGRKRWVPDPRRRQIGAAIVRFREVNKLTFRDIWLHFRKHGIKWYDSKGREREWRDQTTVQRWYYQEKKLQAQESASPSSSGASASPEPTPVSA